ncbi:MAG: hypothetical protein GX130_13985 [Candidatus Hydrogenedens sp.]|nr:hypothetical protein [Candidatus Hydrogenedens sp.]
MSGNALSLLIMHDALQGRIQQRVPAHGCTDDLVAVALLDEHSVPVHFRIVALTDLSVGIEQGRQHSTHGLTEALRQIYPGHVFNSTKFFHV